MIEGAAEGAGLGIQFLRHLERNRLLLHLVDIGAEPEATDPIEAIKMVAAEISLYSDRLAALPRWLVINKIDLIAPDQREQIIADILASLDWKGPVFGVSAATGEGTDELCRAIVSYLDSESEPASGPAD